MAQDRATKRQYEIKYYNSHREVLKERSRVRRVALRHAAIMAYGGYFCACLHGGDICGETEPKYLSIDHINGGGNQHRKKVGGGSVFYLWLKQNNYPAGYRVLCYNCNLSSGFYGQCPRESVGLAS